MKEFSKLWIASKSRKKQRKYVENAPLHLRGGMMSSTLSKELRKKHGRRNLTIKKGDKVKIVRGSFKGRVTTVESVSLTDYRVYLKGVEATRKEGGKSQLGIHPSNLVIQELNLEDKKRKEGLEQNKKK